MTDVAVKPTKAIAQKVLDLVDAGLSSGLGEQKPGKMCVDAVVNAAFGLPHGDNPPCVGYAVRSFKIRLNDAAWSSNKARADGMREIAIAQLGSDTIDQREFANRVVIGTIKKFLPIALRAAASAVPKYAVELEAAAKVCEVVTDMMSARKAAVDSHSLTQTVRDASAAAAADYADYAAAADYASAAAAADYADYADYAAADYASAAAAASAADYADYADYAAAAASAAADAAADYADYADYARKAKRDSVLRMVADMGVAILKELKSPGVKWLGIIKKDA